VRARGSNDKIWRTRNKARVLKRVSGREKDRERERERADGSNKGVGERKRQTERKSSYLQYDAFVALCFSLSLFLFFKAFLSLIFFSGWQLERIFFIFFGYPTMKLL
jgi:hypothetical protein